ncbi:hypothetical protein [Clostridium sp.]|uniref:hypothetical protein n=1 Tax=Clostridium sp. TaxID=1506 RepID=UPI001A3ADBD4|nr:hypothetical protein [Clostridium sp.]MBK5235528.1 hypothetical protein [Clostridium sp.]
MNARYSARPENSHNKMFSSALAGGLFLYRNICVGSELLQILEVLISIFVAKCFCYMVYKFESFCGDLAQWRL